MKRSTVKVLIVLCVLAVLVVIGGGIIAAIAVPNFYSARRAANEAAAISTLRNIHSAEVTFKATEDSGNYGSLSELGKKLLIDAWTASGEKSGYRFMLKKVDKTSTSDAEFEVIAVPTQIGSINGTGDRSFYINSEGIIRFRVVESEGQFAGSSDPELK